MKIGEVSKKLGIPSSTIRYYESEGLIKQQARVSGVRHFDKKTMVTLRFIQLAQLAGFSINEMKTLLENYDKNPDASGMWESLARKKRDSVQNQISNLQRMDKILEKLLTCDCESLNECVSAAFIQIEQHSG